MKRQALVVGINQYPFDENLPTPAADAEAVAQLLEKYGDFEVHRLPTQDAARRVAPEKKLKLEELEEAIIRLFQPKSGIIPETALLFFAGHGLQRERDGETEGFLITSEARPGMDKGLFSLKRLRQLLQDSPVRQQLVWLDCCHSGELFNFTETDLGEKKRGRDRCFIAASREFQVAYGGVLTPALLQGLDPTNQPDGWVTNYSLTDFIEQALKDAPQHSACRNTGGQIILTGKQGVRGNICPYKGLEFFDFNPEQAENAEDPKYFYGRTELTKKLWKKVRSSNFLTLLGASGSGKSSVVRAGLLYQLYLGEEIRGSDRWKIYKPFTPGEHPLRSLEQVVGVKAEQLEPIIKAAAAERVVLVVDQFEEVFTQCRDEAERQQFFKCLMGAVERLGNKLCLVLVMRDDFQHKCAEQDYAGLATKIDQNLVRVKPMSEEELTEAITKPAEQVELEIDRELVNQIIADVSDSPGDLPLLQYTLTQLWEKYRFKRLTLSEYNNPDFGGVKKALENHANQVYKSLSIEQQKAAKRIFLELTRLGEDEQTPNTRQQVRQQDLVNLQQSEALVNQVVQLLAAKKLVVTSEQEIQGKRVAVVNIAHEALIRHWNLLREWLEENREALRTKQDIEDAAKEWRDKGKPKDSAYLWQGSRLTEAENFQQNYADTVSLSGVAQEFVHESIQERQKNRRILAIGGVIGVIVLMFAGVAGVQWRNAEVQRQIVFARRLANQADLTRDQRPELLQRSVLLAVEAMKRSPSSEAYEVLRRGIALLPRPIKSLKHKSGVNYVVFSPDGKYMATNAVQDSVRVWEITSGKEVARLQSAWKIAFSPDSKYLVTASDNIAQVWEFTNGKEVTRMSHEDKIWDIAFSPDGKYLATASWDNTARVWEVTSGREVARMTHDDRLRIVAFSSDGKYVATAVEATERIVGDDFLQTHPAAQVWEATSGKEVARIKHDKSVNAIAFSRNGKYLATASGDNTARISEVATSRPVANMAHQGIVWDVAFSPDGKYLATAAQDQKARVWDMANGTTVAIMAHKELVKTVAFTPDGKYLATVTYPTRLTGEMDTSEHSALLWEVVRGREVARMTHNDAVENIAFSPDGKYVATASHDGTVGVWEAISNRTTVFMTHDNYWSVYAVAFSPDGKYFATASGRVDRSSILRPHKIRVWEASSGRELFQIQDQEEKLTSLTFSPNGKYLSAVSSYGKPRMWEVTSGKDVTPISQHHRGTNPAFTSDGKYKVTVEGKFVYVREVKSGQEVARITHNENVDAVAFSPNGKYLAMTSGFITSESGDSRAWVSLWRPEELMTEACTRLTRNLKQEEWQQYLPNEPYRKTCPNLP